MSPRRILRKSQRHLSEIEIGDHSQMRMVLFACLGLRIRSGELLTDILLDSCELAVYNHIVFGLTVLFDNTIR